MAEKRTDRRNRALLTGKIVYGDGAYSLDCTVRDLSPTGARVALPAGQTIPDAVYLMIIKQGIAYDAKVAWRRGPNAGLEFVGSYTLDNLSDPKLQFLRRLWTLLTAR